MSNPLKLLAGQTVIYGLGTILPRFLNILLTPILTYTFLPAQFGINSELYAYISFLNIIFTYGMETTFFNFNSKWENKAEVFNTAFLTLLVSTLVFSTVFFILTDRIASALSTPNALYLPQFIIWCILIIGTDAITAIPFAKLRAENRALKFSLLKTQNIVVNFGLTIFFLVLCKSDYDKGVHSFYAFIYSPRIGIGYAFLAQLISNVITLAFLSRQIFSVQFSINTTLLKSMLAYTWPLIILGLAGTVNETLDRIILKKLLLDKAEAQIAQGIYGACYKIAILMTIFIQAFRFAAEPFFFGKAKEKDSRQTYALVMKFFVVFCLFLFLATMLNLDWIRYFIEKSYWDGLKVVPILLLANLCLGVIYNLSFWYKISSRTRFGAVISVFGAVVTLAVNIIFVPEYSYMACAWATFAAYSSMMVLSYILGQRFYPIRYNLRAMGFYAVAAIVIYLISLSFAGTGNLTLKIALNNLLILLFVVLVYKLEIKGLKKLNAGPLS